MDHVPLLRPITHGAIAMPSRPSKPQRPRPLSHPRIPQRIIQFADVVDRGAHHGWSILTVPQIMAAGFRMGMILPSERVVQRSLNAAVEVGLIVRRSSGSYGAILKEAT